MPRNWADVKNQERKFALTLIWILSIFGPTLVGFYLGTIWATESYLDLRLYDVQFGGVTALIGLVVGLLFGLVVTFLYPKAVDDDIDSFADFHPRH